METSSNKWVVVAEFRNHPEAELSRNILTGFGIPCRLWTDDCNGLAVGQTVVQGVRLFVPVSHFEESKRLLRRGH